MPNTSENMLKKLGLGINDMPTLKDFDIKTQIEHIKAGTPFEVGDMLFERITPEKVEELKLKYGSSK